MKRRRDVPKPFDRQPPRPMAGMLSAAGLAAAALALGLLTVRRNADYANDLSIWADTAAKAPASARAQFNLGVALEACGRCAEAIARYRQAVQLDPQYAVAHNNLGAALAARGELDEAIEHYRRALSIDPEYQRAYNNLRLALARRK